MPTKLETIYDNNKIEKSDICLVTRFAATYVRIIHGINSKIIEEESISALDNKVTEYI